MIAGFDVAAEQAEGGRTDKQSGETTDSNRLRRHGVCACLKLYDVRRSRNLAYRFCYWSLLVLTVEPLATQTKQSSPEQLRAQGATRYVPELKSASLNVRTLCTEDYVMSTITERFSIAGNELVSFVKGLIADGNVRRLIIRRPSGETLIEVPLTTGVAVGGALTLLAPVIAAIGAMAALIAKFEVDVERIDRNLDHDDARD
ncbi:MAG: DUF4342 domain-containing protein [Thiohalocapsa sp.]